MEGVMMINLPVM